MSGPDRGKLVVLVAEDSAELRTVVTRYLESLGHAVTCAETGRDAIQILKGRHFDLIVTDVLMPEADGLEVMAEAKKHSPSTRLLAVTGGGNTIDLNLCARLAKGMGAHTTLLKPFSMSDFAAALDRALNSPASS